MLVSLREDDGCIVRGDRGAENARQDVAQDINAGDAEQLHIHLLVWIITQRPCYGPDASVVAWCRQACFWWALRQACQTLTSFYCPLVAALLVTACSWSFAVHADRQAYGLLQTLGEQSHASWE